MANLKALRQRINSIKATKKITAAMKLVATSHFRKLQSVYHASKCHTQSLHHCLTQALTHKDLAHEVPPLLKKGTEKRPLMIIIGSDRGLCGGFNVTVSKHALEEAKKLEGDVQFLCVGNKIPSALPPSQKKNIFQTLPSHDKATYSNALTLSFLLENVFKEKRFDSIFVTYNHFKSAISYMPKTQRLIPFDAPMKGLEEPILEELRDPKILFGTEPQGTPLLEALASKYLAAQVHFACVESQMSEQSGRMMAMDSSTRNAEDMLNDLEITYHRSRQTNITNELIEIIAGAESL